MMAHLLEIRQKVFPAPAGVPKRLPGIVIILVAAIPDHSVYDAPATNRFSKGQRTWGTIKLELMRCCEIPIINRTNVAANELWGLDLLLIMVTERGWPLTSNLARQSTYKGPASRQITETSASSERRMETTNPATPQPTTT
jgi:hypothetical protein